MFKEKEIILIISLRIILNNKDYKNFGFKNEINN